MNGAHERPIRKFNPGMRQSDDEVGRQFVVRQRELELLLDVLRGNLDSSSCQHVLIVAPRGRGKTMLLSRIAAELRTNDNLSKRLFPVQFMEESQEIFTLADFWLECLFHLAQACAPSDPGHSRDLLATHADLSGRWKDTNIEERAHAAVLEAADRLDKTLVLMVENLQALCKNVDDDFGWRLRKTLQSEPQITLVASATSRFKEVDDVTQPFFELFRIVDLEPLDTDECRRLWQMVNGNVGKRREIEPLRILTGGNPRLLVISAELSRRRPLHKLLENVMTLIDAHSEYFRSHLEVLAKTERRVYLAVIDLWKASSTGEIAARARMDIRTVSALLGKLVQRGTVLADRTGRKRRYSAAERLYSIYYKLRRERDNAAPVHYLIRFMTEFYSDNELAGLAVNDRGTEHFRINSARELQLEVAEALVDKGLGHGLGGKPEQEVAAINAVVERVEDSDAPDLHVHVAMALFNKAITHGERGETEQALAAYDTLVNHYLRDGDTPGIELQIAMALVNKGVTLGRRGDTEAQLAACDAVVAHFGNSDAPEIQAQVAMALINKGITHSQRDEAEQELAAYNAVVKRFGDSDAPDIQQAVASALVAKGDRQIDIGRAHEALRTCDELERRYGAFTEDTPVGLELWRAKWTRTHALMAQGERQAALKVLRSVCSMFIVNNAPMLREMLTRVPTVIAAGAAAHEVVEILSADTKTADAVAPLIVALRQMAGEPVRASTEVLEVAADVLKRIKKTTTA